MSKIGILESFKPLVVGGEHKTWKSSYGKAMFDFIGIIDGVEGIFSSTSNTPNWKAGQKVSYDQTHKPENKYPKFKLKKFDEDTGKAIEYKNTYNDPKVVVSISHGMCQSIVIDMYINTDKTPADIEKVNIYADIFLEWVMKEGVERDVCSRRYYSLLDAVKLMKCTDTFIKTKEDVINAANALYEHNIKIVKHYGEKEKEEEIDGEDLL